MPGEASGLPRGARTNAGLGWRFSYAPNRHFQLSLTPSQIRLIVQRIGKDRPIGRHAEEDP